ncbi:MAG: hypothetical protein ACR2M9_00630 [Cyanophyceae cyanobacterium]
MPPKMYKCFTCNWVTTNKGSIRSHLQSSKHLINNYKNNSKACCLCLEKRELDEFHMQHHKDTPESIDQYISLLMNERLKDFEIPEGESIIPIDEIDFYLTFGISPDEDDENMDFNIDDDFDDPDYLFEVNLNK